MKKKIKDLTFEEMNDICISQNVKCTAGSGCSCPLLHAGSCLRSFIEKCRYLNIKEVEVDESNNDE